MADDHGAGSRSELRATTADIQQILQFQRSAGNIKGAKKAKATNDDTLPALEKRLQAMVALEAGGMAGELTAALNANLGLADDELQANV